MDNITVDMVFIKVVFEISGPGHNFSNDYISSILVMNYNNCHCQFYIVSRHFFNKILVRQHEGRVKKVRSCANQKPTHDFPVPLHINKPALSSAIRP